MARKKAAKKQAPRTRPPVKAWRAEQRRIVLEYLAHEGLKHGPVGDLPAWEVDPYVAIWAVESLRAPGSVGWWAISGDLPTDYVGAKDARDPREAMAAISARWLEVAACMDRGEPHPEMTIGGPELAPLLRSRAELLAEWAEDPARW